MHTFPHIFFGKSIFSGLPKENMHTYVYGVYMEFIQFRREISGEVFDHPVIAHFFRDLKKPRDKISMLTKAGMIIRLKRGFYIFGEEWRKHALSLETIANVLYGPSCVSFEYALTHYGLISERAQVVTSLAIGDSKTFHTPIGTFEYRAIDREKFHVGIEYHPLDQGGFFIASKEKALTDLVYRTTGIRTKEQLRYFLFEEMRVDEEFFYCLNKKLLQQLADVYKKRSVKMLVLLHNENEKGTQ